MRDTTVYTDGWGKKGDGCEYWGRKRHVCKCCTCRYWHQWRPTRNCVLRVEREHSLEEVAQSMSMTRQRINQIEKEAMLKVMAVLGYLGWEVRDGMPAYSPNITRSKRRVQARGW